MMINRLTMSGSRGDSNFSLYLKVLLCFRPLFADKNRRCHCQHDWECRLKLYTSIWQHVPSPCPVGSSYARPWATSWPLHVGYHFKASVVALGSLEIIVIGFAATQYEYVWKLLTSGWLDCHVWQARYVLLSSERPQNTCKKNESCCGATINFLRPRKHS